MRFLDDIVASFRKPIPPLPMTVTDSRSFVVGPGAVDPMTMFWGNETDQYAPAEYGSYVTSSTVVYAATKMRATLLASLPLKIYSGSGDKRKEIANGEIRDLLDMVNPYWTFTRLMQMTELSLCLWGKNFYFVERGGRSGAPREIWWARPDRVRVVPDSRNYVSHFLYRPTNGSKDMRFEPEETIWIRTPNPLDEFEGLSPVAAARLSADTAQAAVKSNRLIFSNGIQAGGFFAPKAGQTLTKTQAEELTEAMNRRFRGVDKAHRWGVFTFDVDAKSVSMSPKDAEFLGALNWSKEDIAMAFGVPLDLIGGQRTYANVEASERIIWNHTIKPEADFIASELTEQLLPMFGTTGLSVDFDYSDVEVFRENENDCWGREKEQIAAGVITINEWRKEKGMKALPWGDAAWLPLNLVPISTADQAAPPELLAIPPTVPVDPKAAPVDPNAADDKTAPRRYTRAVAYGSVEHERLWQRLITRTTPHEKRVADTTAKLMRSQRQAVMAKLKAERSVRVAEEVRDEPFDRPRWTKAFRVAIRPVIAAIVEDAGQEAADDLNLGISFDVSDPNVIRFLEQRAQRFAVEVNSTTYEQLQASLAEGIDAGEGIDQLADRVKTIMAGRIASSAETIARTETIGASNGGTLMSWRQSGVVNGKEWLAALDSATRDSHAEAHGQIVGIDQDFTVGGGSGPGPGMIGLAEEDCNCRCSLSPVLDTDVPERKMNGNGHRSLLALAELLEVAR